MIEYIKITTNIFLSIQNNYKRAGNLKTIETKTTKPFTNWKDKKEVYNSRVLK